MAWNEAIKIPFVIRYPGRVASGQEIGALINVIDIMPTLLGLAGLRYARCSRGSRSVSLHYGRPEMIHRSPAVS